MVKIIHKILKFNPFKLGISNNLNNIHNTYTNNQNNTHSTNNSQHDQDDGADLVPIHKSLI